MNRERETSGVTLIMLCGVPWKVVLLVTLCMSPSGLQIQDEERIENYRNSCNINSLLLYGWVAYRNGFVRE
jgi:hypothetical protein